jgi:hypothetical protein
MPSVVLIIADHFPSDPRTERAALNFVRINRLNRTRLNANFSVLLFFCKPLCKPLNMEVF